MKNIEKSKVLLKKSQEKFSNEQETSNIRFHFELYRARQTWRIKKTGNKFTCDLSYRTGIAKPAENRSKMSNFKQ